MITAEPIFVVNGEEVRVACRRGTIRGAVRRALKATLNTARPFDAWEVRIETGERVDLARRIVTDDAGAHFFITLAVGAGGAS